MTFDLVRGAGRTPLPILALALMPVVSLAIAAGAAAARPPLAACDGCDTAEMRLATRVKSRNNKAPP